MVGGDAAAADVDVVGRPDGTRPNPIEAQFKWLAETVYPTGNMNQDCLKAQAPGEGWRASTTRLSLALDSEVPTLKL